MIMIMHDVQFTTAMFAVHVQVHGLHHYEHVELVKPMQTH